MMRPYLEPKLEIEDVKMPDVICGSLIMEEEGFGEEGGEL